MMLCQLPQRQYMYNLFSRVTTVPLHDITSSLTELWYRGVSLKCSGRWFYVPDLYTVLYLQ